MINNYIMDQSPRITMTLSEILANTPPVQTLAQATDVPGANLEWMKTAAYPTGAWFGDLGELGTTVSRDSLFTGYLARGVTCKVSGVPYSWNGTGWVNASEQPIKNRKVAAFGTSIGFGAFMASTNDVANSSTMWMPSTAYSVGQYIYPRYADLTNGMRKVTYVCTTAGTTGAEEPVWSVVSDEYTSSGSAVFQAVTTNVTGACFARGFWTFAQAIAKQPLDEAYLVGYEGGKFPAIMSYWDRAIAVSDPGVIFVSDLWLNDISVTAFDTIKAYWYSLVDKINAQISNGAHVILQTVLPKADIDSSANWTGYVYGDETRAWKWLNAKMREFAATSALIHLFVVDDIYTDPNPSNPVWPENSTTFTSQAGTGQALKFTDGTHPYQNAQWRLARRLAPILTSIAGSIDRFAVAGTVDGISANPSNHGTSGATSTNTTGTVADGYTVSGSANCAVVASKASVALTTRSKQVLALSASGTNATAYMLETSQKSTSELSASTIVQAFAEVEISANPSQFRTVQLYLGDNVNSGSLAGSAWTANVNSADQNMDEVPETLQLVMKTPPQTLGSRTTLRTNIQAVMSGSGGAATVAAGRRTIATR